MAQNFNDLFTSSTTPAPVDPNPMGAPLGGMSDAELLDLWAEIKKECIDTRQIFVRQWQRNLLYTLGRQWITYAANGNGWRDTRTAQWIPRPVTNKCKETVQAIRAMFTAIRLGVNVRPSGADPKDVSAAATADDLAPVLHDVHQMASVQNEFDFWLLVTGNAFYHTFLDYDLKYGTLDDPSETCVACQGEYRSSEIAAAGNVCPECGSPEFIPAVDEMGTPILNTTAKSQAVTLALSPLELAFPNSCVRFEDLPYVVRLRWRTKRYYENHPTLKALVPEIVWAKSPTDQSLQLFKSLAQHNDLGVASSYIADGHSGGGPDDDGIAEYEVWMKPNDTYPEGLVFRVIDSGGGLIAHLEDTEAHPGPLPYKDADGRPLFTFAHAGYEHVGGRVLASGPLDVIIDKQNQLNQLDSMNLMSVMRVAYPAWLEPKGAEIERITGQPGLIIRWNPLTVGGNAKPERIDGKGPDASVFVMREQIITDMENLTGSTDALRGIKPSGDTPFSALQLLVERSQARFASVFTARGEAYRQWFKFAIELEREFGPDERTTAVLSPSRKWTFENFKRANLQGSMSIIVEDGSNAPKTNLGMRAALEHANQLGMVSMQDPDQQYEGLKLLGLTKMVPTLDINVQAALQKQEAFESWAKDPAAMQQSMMQAQQEAVQFQTELASAPPPQVPLDGSPMPPPPQPPSILNATPLKWRPWYNPIIHRQEFIKWANGDIVRELLQGNPALEPLLVQHLAEIDMALAQQQMQAMMLQGGGGPPEEKKPGGAGKAMGNSNRESTQGNEPKGQAA